jgi:hypothetical protein
MVITGVAEQIASPRLSRRLRAENGKSLFDYLPAEQSGQMRDCDVRVKQPLAMPIGQAGSFSKNARKLAALTRAPSTPWT